MQNGKCYGNTKRCHYRLEIWRPLQFVFSCPFLPLISLPSRIMMNAFRIVVLLYIIFVSVNGEAPVVQSVQYETKTASLLGTTIDVGVIEVQTNQNLNLLDSNTCPPYACVDEAVDCPCDYTHGASGGCGSTISGCGPCANVEELCGENSAPWGDLEDGVPTFFNTSTLKTIQFRYFHNKPCRGIRV
jgi:hypothetical protein